MFGPQMALRGDFSDAFYNSLHHLCNFFMAWNGFLVLFSNQPNKKFYVMKNPIKSPNLSALRKTIWCLLFLSASSALAFSQAPCSNLTALDFSTNGAGSSLSSGDIITSQFMQAYGIDIQAINNNGPNIAMIFDSSNPTGGDFDLGTPNSLYGGPGQGSGGPGTNTIPLGNILIISEDGDQSDPDDEASGGKIILDFNAASYIESVTLVDIDHNGTKIKVRQVGNNTTTFNAPNLGDNSVQTIAIGLNDVNRITIDACGSFALGGISFCDAVQPMTAAIMGPDSICHGDNCTLSAQVSGGQAPYSYAWLHGPVSPSVSVGGGNYTVQITDAFGATTTLNQTVHEPLSPITIHDTVSSNEGGLAISCHGAEDGWIKTAMIGGFGGYSYHWSHGATSENVYNLAAGTYSLTVEDVFGCAGTQSWTLEEPTPMQLDMSSEDVSCHGSDDGTVSVLPSGSIGTYTYAWDNGATSAHLTSLPAGTYTVTATDMNGCEASSSVTIGQPEAITIDFNVQQPFCGQAGSINTTVNNGIGNLDYSWSNGATTPDLAGLPAGTYILKVTDENGCTGADTVELLPSSAISVAVEIGALDCDGSNSGQLNATVQGGVSNLTYTWSNGGTGPQLSGISGGTYTVTVTDPTGNCTGQASIALPMPLDVNPVINLVSCPGSSDGSADLQVNGGTAPYSFLWSDGSMDQQLTGASEGTYNVQVTDAAGCNYSLEVEVEAMDAPIADAGGDQTFACGESPVLNAVLENGLTGSWTVAGTGTVLDANDPRSSVEVPADMSCTFVWTVDRNGCTSSDSARLYWESCPVEPPVPCDPTAFPTGITPNGDYVNDYYTVDCLPANTRLLVMNRWGNEVYEDLDYQGDWNGVNSDGEPLAEGTYFVLVEGEDNKGKPWKLKSFVDIRRDND